MHLSGGICIGKGERVNCNHHYQNQQDRHHPFGYFFNSLFHPIVHDESSDTHEKQGEDHR